MRRPGDTGGRRSRRRTRRGLIAASAAVVLAVALPAAPEVTGARERPGWPGTADYSVPVEVLDAALDCSGPLTGRGRAQPVLLVHGTALNAHGSWSWNYMQALPAAGFETCWVELPASALGDAQISAEYAAHAVEVMARRSLEPVDVVGHSQGGLVARWAVRWFPSAVAVDDIVMLGVPNHGTVLADVPTLLRGCFESCWQMRTKARFLDALNRDDETPGPISYTSIFSTSDEIVQPHTSSKVEGASNVHVQAVCPGRPVGHMEMLGDGMVHAVVVHALRRPGPAKASRLPEGVCTRTTMPGTTYLPASRPPDWREGRLVDREPVLKAYART